MNHLHRDLAPITEEAWDEIEVEARARLKTYLAARRLVDFTGPHGWDYSAHNVGRSVPAAAPADGVEARARKVMPLVEFRVPFTLDRAELDSAARGNPAIDLDPLHQAAKRIAFAENSAVFNGYPDGHIDGIAGSTTKDVEASETWDRYPMAVAAAVEQLMLDGVSGPYGLALGSDVWTGVVETTEHGGYPLMEHLTKILGGPIVWSPGLEGGIVVSQRGGDFIFDSGLDLSIGYLSHDASTVTLYLEESFTFLVNDGSASVTLRSRAGAAK